MVELSCKKRKLARHHAFGVRRLISGSYIITNYEQSNFSVFQSKFQDEYEPEIVAISSAGKDSSESHTTRSTIIGVSLGIGILFSLSLLAILWTVKKKQKQKMLENHKGEGPLDPTASMASQQQLVQEISADNIISLYRELPDNGRAELFEPSAPIAHELMTRGHSDERSMIQYHNSRDTSKMPVSHVRVRDSSTTIDTSTSMSYGQTNVYSHNPRTMDVERSLPPTPISESLQVSPVEGKFSRRVTARQRSDLLVEESAAVKSVCGAIGQVPPHILLHPRQRALGHSSDASMVMDMEIIIPPYLENDFVSPLNSYNNSKRGSRAFF